MAAPAFQLARPLWLLLAGAGGWLVWSAMPGRWHSPQPVAPGATAIAVAALAPSAATPEPSPPINASRRAPGALPEDILQALREVGDSRQSARLQAGLRTWAGLELEAAGEWALAQAVLHHDLALSAVIQGGANDPDRLTSFVGKLSARFPERAAEYGSYLIAALNQANAHEKAAAFAATAEDGIAMNWLTAAYSSWGRREPDRALRHLALITDEARRSTAFQATISGWARTDPAELVAVAERMSGPHQRFALLTGMHAWIERDPAAAAAWIAHGPPDIEWERILDN